MCSSLIVCPRSDSFFFASFIHENYLVQLFSAHLKFWEIFNFNLTFAIYLKCDSYIALYSAKKDLPKECTLLCGTAVGLLLGIICTELKTFVSTRESIIQLLLAAGKMSIFIFLFPFCYFYLTKLFVSHNYIFILCYSSSLKG